MTHSSFKIIVLSLCGLIMVQCSGMESEYEKREKKLEKFKKERISKEVLTRFECYASGGIPNIIARWPDERRKWQINLQSMHTLQTKIHCYKDCENSDFITEKDDKNFNELRDRMDALLDGITKADIKDAQTIRKKLDDYLFDSISDDEIARMEELNKKYDVLKRAETDVEDMADTWDERALVMDEIMKKKDKKCAIM